METRLYSAEVTESFCVRLTHIFWTLICCFGNERQFFAFKYADRHLVRLLA